MAERNFVERYPDSVAVLMGTWQYRHLESVPAVENSMNRMRALLTSDLCGWPSDQVRDDLRNVARPGDVPDQLVETFADVRDVALFYYVGHGQVDPSDRLCLGLTDSRSDPRRRATTSLSYDAVRDALRHSRAKLKIVILDCCYAGLATQSGRLNGGADVIPLLQGTGASVLAASAAYATAWFDDEPANPRPETFFTRYLVDLVEWGIPGQGPELTLTAIADRLASNLERAGKPSPTSLNTDFGGSFTFAANMAHLVPVSREAPATPPAGRSDWLTATRSVFAMTGRETPPQLWGSLPRRNPHFVGRADLLDRIRTRFRQHTEAAFVPLHGILGAGKTQAAVEFAYRHQFDYQLVWRIKADSAASVRESLVALARRFDLDHRVDEKGDEQGDEQDVIDRVMNTLRRGDPYSRWLLIYDDAAAPAVIEPYLPGDGGHVLVTTRDRTWARRPDAIEVDVFDPRESVAMLRGRWAGLSEEQALRLADELGHLPQALDQVVTLHDETGLPPEQYLRMLREDPCRMLAEGATDQATSLTATIERSAAAMRTSAPGAAHLLQLCAFLGPHPIAIALLLGARDVDAGELRDDITLRRTIRELARHGLARLDVPTDTLHVHRLVQDVMRHRLPDSVRDVFVDQAATMLASAAVGPPDDPGNWPAHERIAPHVVPAGLLDADSPSTRWTVLYHIRYHHAIGDYETSRTLAESAVETWRAADRYETELCLLADVHWAAALRELGMCEQARVLGERTLQLTRRALGQGHEATRAAELGVAADLRMAGRLRQALELDTENLARHQEMFGGTAQETMRAVGGLATDLRLTGDFAQAKEHDETTLHRSTKSYGADHPVTLSFLTALAFDHYGLGEYTAGLAVAREALARCERVLPERHRDRFVARRNRVILLRKAGYHVEAVSLGRELLDACRQRFGDKHHHTLSVLTTTGNAYLSDGGMLAAAQDTQAALTGYRATLGDAHPFTLACMVNMSVVMRLLDRADEASELVEVVLTMLTETVGRHHPHTLCAANTRSNGLAAAGHLDEAVALGEQTLDRFTRVCGPSHPDTLACAANLSFDLERTGDLVRASRLRGETLGAMNAQLGAEHPTTVNAGTHRRVETEIEVPAL